MDQNVTSNNQSGGITANTVKAGKDVRVETSKNEISPPEKKISKITIIVTGATIIGVLIAILTYFGIKP